MDQYIGMMLDNRYELLEVVGTGGMAVVYKAKCHRLNRYVAVKILKAEAAADPELLRRFRDESQAVAMLSHPNIVAVYDVSKTDHLEYIVMELIDGITLKQYMNQKGGSLPWKEALHFITQIMRALRHAHSRGIIHRDIKPHNVMVLRDGSAKVADFGIAHLSNSQNTTTQEALGSVHYISPEQAKGIKVDARTDIYSAGVVLYEMLTGKLPYEGDSPVAVAIKHINSTPVPPRALNPSIPEGLEQITMKAMASKPADRYDSARSMLMDLDAFRKNPSIVFPYGKEVPKQEPEPKEDDDQDATRIVPAGTELYGKPTRTRPPRRTAYTEAEEEPEQEETPRRRSKAKSRELEEEPERRSRVKSRVQEQEEERKKGRKASFIAVLAIVLIMCFTMVVLFIVHTLSSGTVNQPEHTVPNLVSMQYEEAVLRYGSEFNILIVGYREDESYNEGVILEQDPQGEEVITGSGPTINVVVCQEEDSGILGYMPNLYEATGEDAVQTLVNMGVPEANIVKGNSVYSDSVSSGCVVSTSPAYGASLDKNTVITYYLSMGKDPNAPVPVPSVVGLSKNDAIDGLLDSGITNYTTEEEYSDTVSEGVVIRTSPTAGTSVTPDESVTLVISKGQDPATLPVTVPSFVGQDETMVMVQLASMNLTGSFNRVTDDAAAGTVLTQSVESGTQVDQGTNIIFTVSDGPAESPSPEPEEVTTSPEQPSENPSEEQDTPAAVTVDKTITVSLPQQEGEVRVQVDLEGVTVYANSVDCANGSIDIPISGSGSQQVDVYIDGSLTSSETVDFS